MRTDCDIDSVIAVHQFPYAFLVIDIHVQLHLYACLQNRADIPLQPFPGKTVAGDSVAEHTSQLFPLLEHRRIVPHQRQIEGRGQTAGAAADDSDPLSGIRHSSWNRHLVRTVIYGEHLQSPDVQRCVDHVSSAVAFAGVFTNQGAYRGERIILADQPHRIIVASAADQRHIARNVHLCRTFGNTGDRMPGVPQMVGTAVFLDMGYVVFPEALHSLQHYFRRLRPDRAVRGIPD